MKIEGKLIEVTEPQEMTTKNGKSFIKATAIIETEGQYPKKIAVTLPNEELISKVASLQLNNKVAIDVNVESREYNGRWYTELKAWRV
jgi:hypothetical protein